jgi:Zn-dependent protease
MHATQPIVLRVGFLIGDKGMRIPTLDIIISRLIILLVGLPIHEWAHAWSAYELGDDTASLQGRMSLNPLAHLDPFGSILLLLTGFGWAKPVPVNPYRMRVNPRTGMALSALAGPASNFLVAMLCAIPFRLGLAQYVPYSIAELLFNIGGISLGLGIFNLLPAYPLDGEKVLVGVLPRQWADMLISLRPYSPFILMGLIFLGGTIISPILQQLMILLFY